MICEPGDNGVSFSAREKKGPPPGSYVPSLLWGLKVQGKGPPLLLPPAPPAPLPPSLGLLWQTLLGDILSYKEMNATRSLQWLIKI